MKNYNFYVISACLLLLFSCATDDEIITEDSTTLNSELYIQETNDSTLDITKNPIIDNQELKANMHWISFVTAETFMQSINARQNFSYLAAGQDYVELEDLIGDDANGVFKTEFYINLTSIISEAIQEAIYQMNCQNDPMSCGAPEPPATTPPLPSGTGPSGSPFGDAIPTVQQVIDYLINYVLNDQCFEVFVPKTLPTSSQDIEIAATEHPLSSVQSNEAAIFTNGIIQGSTHRDIYYDIIYPSFIGSGGPMANNNFVVIVRPERTRTCLYSEYARIDFKNFFN
ncbi:hypothetical protein [Dokdonia sp.]|uniref:hypothetical protein n=1 Tax=Dokdonia sp. TaxID=2024995 RepID=UPI003262D5EC